MSQASPPPDLLPASFDFATLVFTLSAVPRDRWERVVRTVHSLLKPGGFVCLRDYGMYDMTMGRCAAPRHAGLAPHSRR